MCLRAGLKIRSCTGPNTDFLSEDVQGDHATWTFQIYTGRPGRPFVRRIWQAPCALIAIRVCRIFLSYIPSRLDFLEYVSHVDSSPLV